MKKLLFIAIVFSFGLVACAQVDQTFTKPIHVVEIIFADGTSLKSAPVPGTLEWAGIIGKPLTYPPAPHRHSWSDLDDLPVLVNLQDALETLGYLPIPQKSTTELASVILPAGKSGIVYDKTLKVYKLWDGQGWLKIVITNN